MATRIGCVPSSVPGRRSRSPSLLGTITGIAWPGPLWAIPAMSAMSVLGFLLTRCRGWLPVPSLFLVFATGTVSSSQHVWGDVVDAVVIASAAALLGVAIGQIGRLIPKSRRKNRTAPQLSPLHDVLRAAGVRAELVQYAIAPLVAGLAAIALGLGHPYWAAVSATVPIVGKTLEIQLGRATLRILGTAIGIGIGFVLIAMQPPLWVLVVEVAVFQVITELLVARNYGIAVMCITPLALILSHLAAPASVGELVTDRLLDTVLGVVVAVLVLTVGHYSTHTSARHR